ncbi:MAG: PilZ domain-containing protein, partial [Bradyrhizobium sp.]
NSTLSCIVRNFHAHGAKIELDDAAAMLPDELDFAVARKGLSCVARLVWRDRNAAGLTFAEAHKTDVIPLDWARKLRNSERTNQMLRARIEQLRSER